MTIDMGVSLGWECPMSVKPRSPFEPFTTVIGICAGLYAVAFAFGLFSAILGWATSMVSVSRPSA
jgi:hypothetical protein